MKGFQRQKVSFLNKIETLRQNTPYESDEDKKKLNKKIQDMKDKEVLFVINAIKRFILKI